MLHKPAHRIWSILFVALALALLIPAASWAADTQVLATQSSLPGGGHI